MLTINITRYFRKRGIQNPFNWLVERGVSRNQAVMLRQGKNRSIRFTQLEKLCELFECTPDGLFEWKPGPKQNSETHPCRGLLYSEAILNVQEHLETLSPEDMDDVARYILAKKSAH